MEKIAVIGAGTMGNGIAHVLAQFGKRVLLIDQDALQLKKAIKNIEKNLERQAKKEIIQTDDIPKILARIKSVQKIDAGIADMDLIIEAVSEDLELKKKIFTQLDQHSKSNAILASNTSSISITQLAAFTQKPQKVVGMHFMNPVPVMELVEIVKSAQSDDNTLHQIKQLSLDLHKTPVVVNDYPGFISNRILMPMINEAIYALQEGVANAEAIDEIMQLGMAHPMGPLKLADFIGLDVCLSILQVLYTGFGNPKYAPCPLLVNKVNAKHLGKKTGKGFYDWKE